MFTIENRHLHPIDIAPTTDKDGNVTGKRHTIPAGKRTARDITPGVYPVEDKATRDSIVSRLGKMIDGSALKVANA